MILKNQIFDGIRVSQDNANFLDGKSACLLALNYVGESDISPNEKFKRYQLIKRIEGSNGEMDVCPEDVVFLKEVTGAFPFSVKALGHVWEWLNG